jgi:hypothetical protein
MKRSPLRRRTPLKTGRPMARSPIKRGRPVLEHGDSRYRAWVQRQPCCAPGCTQPAPSQAHHHNLMGAGVARKAHDRYAMPLCVEHHVFGLHALAGPFKGWTRAQLKLWQDEQCVRFQAIYATGGGP